MTATAAGAASRRLILLAFAGILIAATVVGAIVWRAAYERALDAAEAEGRQQLRFVASALEMDLARYKLLAKSLSQTAVVRRLAAGRDVEGEAAALFERMAAISGAEAIFFAPRGEGPTRPPGEGGAPASFGVMGLAFDEADGGAFVISAPFGSNREVRGAVVVRLAASQLEWSWRALSETIFFTGADGRIRLSSLPGLRLLTLAEANYPSVASSVDGARRAIWRLDEEKWSAVSADKPEALAIRAETPSISMTGYALVNVSASRRAAWLAAVAAAASLAVVGLVIAVFAQRRAALANRLALEARAKTELEIMVSDRTIELTAEIAERREAERRLRATQDDLIQAGKLSALGEMAAGIAHEINQPLAAIKAFAENADTFLQRGRAAEARSNLAEIGSLTDRAARIIRNLRAFARNEPTETRPLDVRDVVDDSMTILSPRVRESGATVDWRRPDAPMTALAGGVRLQQVIVNLVANALDSQQAEPFVSLTLDVAGERIRLTVRDRGPGIADAAAGRVFDPFFSTKGEAGGEGLGLGLSISYGIVRAFGGEISGANHPEGGAVFTVLLPRAEALRAAS